MYPGGGGGHRGRPPLLLVARGLSLRDQVSLVLPPFSPVLRLERVKGSCDSRLRNEGTGPVASVAESPRGHGAGAHPAEPPAPRADGPRRPRGRGEGAH